MKFTGKREFIYILHTVKFLEVLKGRARFV